MALGSYFSVAMQLFSGGAVVSKKVRQAKRAVKLIGQSMDVSAGALSKQAHIDLQGNREALVDGCRGVLEYTDSAIKINVGSGHVRFCGSGLELRSLAGDQAVVSGHIKTIEFV